MQPSKPESIPLLHSLNEKNDAFNPHDIHTVTDSSISRASILSNAATVGAAVVSKLKDAPSNPTEIKPSSGPSVVEQDRNDADVSTPIILTDISTTTAEESGSAKVVPPNMNINLSRAEEFIHFCSNNRNSSLETIMSFLLRSECSRNRMRRNNTCRDHKVS